MSDLFTLSRISIFTLSVKSGLPPRVGIHKGVVPSQLAPTVRAKVTTWLLYLT
jgi:hypothetical protein